MIIRSGFVSNSSSSSFIIGIVNVGPYATSYSFVFTGPESISGIDMSCGLNDPLYELTIESFNGNEVSCNARIGDKILYLDSVGPDGDSDFAIYDEDGDFIEYDYDIDLDDFDDKDIIIYNLIVANGGRVCYGAGRNG